MDPSVVKRFESKFVKTTADECWPWNASLDSKGYGQIKVNGKPMRAHRLSYIIYRGEIPEGYCICHQCDIPECINPWHLFVGTQQENMTDKVSKGRQLPGEKHPNSKLTQLQVDEIRKKTMSSKDMAIKYGVTISAIHKILSGTNWST